MYEKIPILIAARLSSKRLPGKALLKIYDKPMIVELVERLKCSKHTSDIIVCTSKNNNDDKLCSELEKYKINFFRGDELDVMSRYISVATDMNAETVVRVTADNPLTDTEIMDELIESHVANKSDYTYAAEIPDGAESEIIQTDLLLKCHKMIKNKKNTEYMSWFLNNPKYFKVNKIQLNNTALRRKDVVLTVDIQKDFELLKKIFKYFEGKLPSLEKIIVFYDQISREFKRNEKDSDSLVKMKDIDHELIDTI